MEIGRDSGAWINDKFLVADGVRAGNPEHLRSLLQDFARDPCDEGGKFALRGINLKG